MEIKQKIEEDFKDALKRRDQETTSTLRMLKAAIHNREIENRNQGLEEEQVYKIISKQLKQHQDSIEQFTKGNRPELAEKEARELEILKKYLPQLMSAEEVTGVVKKLISQTAVPDAADFGKIMKMAMAQLKGKADGQIVSQIVTSLVKPLKE